MGRLFAPRVGMWAQGEPWEEALELDEDWVGFRKVGDVLKRASIDVVHLCSSTAHVPHPSLRRCPQQHSPPQTRGGSGSGVCLLGRLGRRGVLLWEECGVEGAAGLDLSSGAV